jgi:curli biogenesis system outer membrane secretion channel CsgG
MHRLSLTSLAVIAAGVGGCATPQPPSKPISLQSVSQAQPTPPSALAPAQPTLKRKVAIARFSNSTIYGRALLTDGADDPLADQASDMLMSRLVDSGRFLVLERRDLGALESEAAITKSGLQLIGADTLIVGSVTQFGRQAEGEAGFLSSTKRQTASATVEVRLVDARTGVAFFSTTGTGTASVEAGEVAGFGSRAAYDSTLNDKAIAAAISDLITNVLQKLEDRPWTTDILDVNGNQVRISGGPRQGLKIGDEFTVQTRGKTVVSQQSGVPITLPGNEVARIRVVSFFGNGDAEGATAQIVTGSISPADARSLVVGEEAH